MTLPAFLITSASCKSNDSSLDLPRKVKSRKIALGWQELILPTNSAKAERLQGHCSPASLSEALSMDTTTISLISRGNFFPARLKLEKKSLVRKAGVCKNPNGWRIKL